MQLAAEFGPMDKNQQTFVFQNLFSRTLLQSQIDPLTSMILSFLPSFLSFPWMKPLLKQWRITHKTMKIQYTLLRENYFPINWFQKKILALWPKPHLLNYLISLQTHTPKLFFVHTRKTVVLWHHLKGFENDDDLKQSIPQTDCGLEQKQPQSPAGTSQRRIDLAGKCVDWTVMDAVENSVI